MHVLRQTYEARVERGLLLNEERLKSGVFEIEIP